MEMFLTCLPFRMKVHIIDFNGTNIKKTFLKPEILYLVNVSCRRSLLPVVFENLLTSKYLRNGNLNKTKHYK